MPPTTTAPQFLQADREQTLRLAERALRVPQSHIPDVLPPEPLCKRGDYYSNGEYWWPDPSTTDGLPHIRRDGYENPDTFKQHRVILRHMAGACAAMTAAYQITGRVEFANKAWQWLHAFFVQPETRMNPHMTFAQAVPGRSTGRSFGIIDTRSLLEIPQMLGVLEHATLEPALEAHKDATLYTIKQWFLQYMHWLQTHPYGLQEKRNLNNHATCYAVQVSTFARFTNDQKTLSRERRWFKRVLLPAQMASDGSFPKEIARTRPYSYSIFNMEQMVMLCHLLSEPDDDLWRFELPDGRGVKRGLDYLFGYLDDRDSWPFEHDVEGTGLKLPMRMTWMLLVAEATGQQRWADLWQKLPAVDDEQLLTNQHTCRYASLWLPAGI